MSKHTPEPWHVETELDVNVDEDVFIVYICHSKTVCNTTTINYDISIEDALRIVQCVNACAGIKNPQVYLSKLAYERDRAWEELQDIRKTIDADPEEATSDEVVRQIAIRDKKIESYKEAYQLVTGQNEKKLRELRTKVLQVLDLQQKYFKTRDRDVLVESKQAEKELRNLAEGGLF